MGKNCNWRQCSLLDEGVWTRQGASCHLMRVALLCTPFLKLLSLYTDYLIRRYCLYYHHAVSSEISWGLNFDRLSRISIWFLWQEIASDRTKAWYRDKAPSRNNTNNTRHDTVHINTAEPSSHIFIQTILILQDHLSATISDEQPLYINPER
jgi:hypothetical protein